MLENRRFSVLVAALCAAILLAATPAGGAEPGPWRALFQDAAVVHVLNVEVFVSDASGLPVTGLDADDFELLENGQPVEVSNFYAVERGAPVALSETPPKTADASETVPAVPAPATAPAAPPEERRLRLVVYVDNANIQPANRARVFSHLRDFLATRWRPELDVMVVSNERALVVRQPFTGERSEVLDALEEVERSGVRSPRFDLDLRQLARIFERDVNVEAGSGLYGVKDPKAGGRPVSQVDDSEVDSQAEVTARESNAARGLLLQVSAYSQERLLHTRQTLAVLEQLLVAAAAIPGRVAVVYVSDGLSLKPGEGLLEGYSRRFALLGGVGAVLSPQVEASRDEALAEFDDLVRRANTSRVTFYPLDAAPGSVLERGSAATKGGAGGNFGDWDDALESTEERNRQEPLVMMADGTGGRAGLAKNTFDDVLGGILDDFDNYYSLGYAVDPEGPERREVEVRVKGRRDLRLRYRTSFRVLSVAEQMAERAMAALFLGELDNPLDVTLRAQPAVAAKDDTFEVPLLAEIPLGRLVLLPGASEHQARLALSVAVRDDRGRVSDVVEHLCPIRIKNAEVLTALGRKMVCGVRLLMRGGHQEVVVVVRDELAGTTSSARLEVEVGEGAGP